MKIATSNLTFKDLPLGDAIERIAELGYAGIEIPACKSLPPSTDPAERQRIRVLANRFGLAIVGFHDALPATGHRLCTPDPEERSRALQWFLAVVDLCADVGAKMVTVGSPWSRNIPDTVNPEVGYRYAVDAFREAGLRASDRGVTVAIECLNRYEANYARTMAEAVKMLQDCGGKGLGITIDTFHMNIEEDPIHDAIQRHARHVVHVHLGDSNRQEAGRGNVDFVAVLRALQDAGFNGWLSFELPPLHSGVSLKSTPERALREGLENIQKVLALLQNETEEKQKYNW